MNDIDYFMEIPNIFHSDATGKPFPHCIVCNKDLLKPGVHYIIEKAIRNYKKFDTTDTIFEYAMCMGCAMQLQETLSSISKQRIETYFKSRWTQIQKMKQSSDERSISLESRIASCVIKGTPVTESSEYQIIGQCVGKYLLLLASPFAISGEAMDEISDLLSNQTLDSMNGFKKRFLGVPPELESILKDHIIIL